MSILTWQPSFIVPWCRFHENLNADLAGGGGARGISVLDLLPALLTSVTADGGRGGGGHRSTLPVTSSLH